MTVDMNQMLDMSMGLDYRKAVRNILLATCLISLPVILVLLQCCNPNPNETPSPLVVSSVEVWRVSSQGNKSINTQVHLQDKSINTQVHLQDADVYLNNVKTLTARTGPTGMHLHRGRDKNHVEQSYISHNADADENDENYRDLDYKIRHKLDVDESESEAYYKRMAVLEARDASTSPKPDKLIGEPVDCSLLFQGDDSEIKRATLKLKLIQHRTTDQDIINLTKDCPAYIKNRGYVTKVLSSVESDFPLAFGIRLHDRSAQVEMLLRAIYRPNNMYCLSVDKKSPKDLHDAMRGIANCFPNVFIASKLERYVYTGFSPVAADLQCMQDIVATGAPWKYFLNLAGTEFPLKTNREIVEILTALNGTNDIEQYTFPKNYYHRFGWRHLVIDDHLINTNEVKEEFDGNVTIQKGCSYNSYSRAFVEWLLNDELAQRFINWTKDTDSPDELVWASLNHLPQAPGGYQMMVTQTAKTFLSREVIWYSSAAYCHSSLKVRGICILSVGDLKWIGRRWELFANKFDINFDHYSLDCLMEALNNRTAHPNPDQDIIWYGIYRAPHVTTTPSAERKRYM